MERSKERGKVGGRVTKQKGAGWGREGNGGGGGRGPGRVGGRPWTSGTSEHTSSSRAAHEMYQVG